MGTAWRSPASPVEELFDLELPVRIVRQAERARFDAVFFADVLRMSGMQIGRDPDRTGYEPLTLISAMAPLSSHIGLIATASTTFVHPFHLARLMSGVDWLSGRRAGWNAVTSTGGGEFFGMELPPKAERYERAHEYMDVVNSLWDAGDDDAVVNDRDAGMWARRDAVHPIDHDGAYYRVMGELPIPRSPQGRPVIVQAGQSPEGLAFAARHAEIVFTAQTELGSAQAFYAELKERAAAEGRDPERIRVLPGVTPIVAPTTEQARGIATSLGGYADVESGRAELSAAFHLDLAGLDPDLPVPIERMPDPGAARDEAARGSRYRNIHDLAVRDRLTLRELIVVNDLTLGHRLEIGTPGDVSDALQEWFDERACDGFVVAPATVPEGLDSVCDLLMPELRRRGLAKTEYTGRTLRQNLGLERPHPQGRR